MNDKHLSGRFAREKLELTHTSNVQDSHSDVTMNQVPIEVFKSEKLDDSLNKRALEAYSVYIQYQNSLYISKLCHCSSHYHH